MKILTKENLSASIIKYRTENNLSQKEFAKKVGLSLRMIQYIEKAEIGTSMDIAEKILTHIGYEIVFYKKD